MTTFIGIYISIGIVVVMGLWAIAETNKQTRDIDLNQLTIESLKQKAKK